ncbi:hypothetical protein EV646_102636 [Kribbella antiqua]|uniref:Ribosomal L7/L12-like protein n=1 Tax=Kribbella antiqua TaxID=2512217 RepID=A0A4R2J009_9ACTN|nr:hypothetical protein [Kribbella antiqua]TCO50562.1 hypothetical protein EV646_102636 [Kribbella antiqua]
MTGFIIFVVVMVVVALINKAKQQSRSGDARQRAIQKLTRAANQPGNPPGSGQAGAALQQLLQAGRQPRHLGEHASPGQPSQAAYPAPMPYMPPGQFQPPPATWLPSYQPQGHRPPQNQLPTPRQDTDTRVRELMGSGNEVAAIRLLCDEQDMGILEAQEYARGLVAPPGKTAQPKPATPQAPVPVEDEATRYVGSAAFAESIFDLDREENTWASGWVDTPEPEDRSDIDELWQTVRNPPRPGAQPS